MNESGKGVEGLSEEDLRDDDDTPWADPAIEQEYQAALGQFVVEYNRLDNLVSKVIRYALHVLGRSDLVPKYLPRNFAAKVDALEMLSLTKVLGLNAAPFADIRAISAMRNSLVHAHFDQNPFDGSYVLVQPKNEKELNIEAPEVRQWAKRTADACWKLGHAEAAFQFREVTVTPQEEAP